MTHKTTTEIETNADPITGEPGSHPVGTGVGAAGGAATGVAVGGAVGGPAGALVGGAVGAVAGGLAGHGIAEAIDPTIEERYWRETYASRPYVPKKAAYDDYAPAYRYGWETRGRYPANQRFANVESDLERGWDKARGRSKLAWSEARNATHDAWDRIERAMPGDFDHDGR